MKRFTAACGCALLLTQPATPTLSRAADVTLVNASYDATRALYQDLDAAFTRYYGERVGDRVKVRQLHGASGAQASAVANGLQADVVTLGIADDLDAISERGLVAHDWRTRPAGPWSRSAGRRAPFYSTILFVVRKGNPKHIADWNDLVRPGVAVVTANPKTSGGGRWAYLAAWGYARSRPGATDASSRDFLEALYRNAPVLDAAASTATQTFVARGAGDVLLAWESEALRTVRELGRGEFELVAPPVSILAEPPVAVVDAVVGRRHTRAAAEAYVDYLYSAEGQKIAARHAYRPAAEPYAHLYASLFPAIRLLTVQDVAGGWPAARRVHFAEGGLVDQVLRARQR